MSLDANPTAMNRLLLALACAMLWPGALRAEALPIPLWAPIQADEYTLQLHHLDRAVKASDDGKESSPAGDPFAAIESGGGLLGDGPDDALAGPRQAPTFRAAEPVAVRGDHTFIKQGRFAGGLHLPGGESAVVVNAQRGNPHDDKTRTLSAWFRTDQLPDKPVALLLSYCTQPNRQPRARPDQLVDTSVALLPDGRLRVAYAETAITTDAVFTANTWHHIALAYGGGGGNVLSFEVHVDGHPVVDRRVPKRDIWRNETFLVGNSRDFDAGFVGDIDQVHLSNTLRAYAPAELGWTDVAGQLDRAVAEPYFRRPDGQQLHLTFDKTLTPAVAPEGVTSPDLGGPIDAADIAIAALAPVADDGSSSMRRPPAFHDGVQRTGLVLDSQTGNGLRWRGPTLLTSEAGTLAFWIRPIDWNNAGKWHQFMGRPRKRLPLLSLHQDEQRRLYFSLNEEVEEQAPGKVEFTPGRWMHVALTWTDKGRQIYINGQPVSLWDGTFDYSKDAWDDGQPATLTLHRNDKRTLIDELHSFDHALAQSEIENLMALVDRRRALEPLAPMELAVHANGVTGRVNAQVIPLLKDPSQIDAIELQITPASASQPLATTTQPYEGQDQLDVALTVADGLAFGDYQVAVTLLDAKGQAIDRRTTDYTRVKPPWWKNDIGVSDEVLPGWKPIKVNGPTASFTRRAVTFGDFGLPTRIEADGQNMLAEPVRLLATANGSPIAFNAHTPTVTSVSESQADITARAQGSDITIDTQATLSFDGFMWYTLTLKGDTPLESLTLEVPMHRRDARLMHWWSGHAGFRNPRVVHIGQVPDAQGQVFASNDSKRVQHAANQRGNFIPYTLLTGDQRGLAWFAENDQGWTKSDAAPAVSIERRGDQVVLVLRIITEPTDISDGQTIRFGLQPNPLRELVDHWRSTDAWSVAPDGFMGNLLKGDKSAYFWRHPVDMDWDAVQRRIDGNDETSSKKAGVKNHAASTFRRFERLHGREPQLHQYSVPALYIDLQRNGNGYPDHTRDFAAQWHAQHGAKIYDEDLVDYYVWIWREWVERTFITGFYMDDCFNVPIYDAHSPVAYTMPDSHVQPGFQWRGYRQQFLRMRRVVHEAGKTPRFAVHSTHTMFSPYHSFIDVMVDGEDHYSTPPKPRDFIDAWPFDRLRFIHPQRWGWTPSWLGWRAGGDPGPTTADWDYMQRRAFTAAALVHDLMWTKNLGGHETSLKNEMIHELGIRTADDIVFRPYWDLAGLADYDDTHLKVSAWLYNGKCLVAIANPSEQRIDAAIKLDPVAMGFGADQKLVVRDVDPTVMAPKVEDEPETPTVELGGGSDFDLEAALMAPDSPEEARAQDPDAQFEFEGQTLTCPVRRHDFRLFLIEPTAK